MEIGIQHCPGMCVDGNSTSGNYTTDGRGSRERTVKSRTNQCYGRTCNTGSAICNWYRWKSEIPYSGIYRYTGCQSDRYYEMTNFKRPGQGILTSTDDIVIPFYHNGITEENASIVWSSDNGETWSRTDDVPGSSNGGWWSSESEVIELSDGTLRMFFRSNQGVIC